MYSLQRPQHSAVCWSRSWSCPTPSCKTSGLLCSWIPGHTLCLAPTRSYWMFLSPSEHSCPSPGSPCAASPQQDTPCPTQSRNPKIPPRGFQSLPRGSGGQARAQRLHRGCHGSHSQEPTAQLHLLLKLPRAAQGEAQS